MLFQTRSSAPLNFKEPFLQQRQQLLPMSRISKKITAFCTFFNQIMQVHNILVFWMESILDLHKIFPIW